MTISRLGRGIVVYAGLLRPVPRPHIMAMSFPLPTYTVDMVRAFPDDGQRYELVEGILLVTPAPASDHQIVVSRLMYALNNYLGVHGPAYVVSPGEIEIAPKLHLEPDVLVFPSTFSPGTKWTEISDWWLAVEVLSPSSKHYDRDYKLEAYLRLGVAEVWIVDLDRRWCEVSGTDGRRAIRESHVLRWHPPAMTRPLELDVRVLLRDIA
jgi:Uma2 family endonuclease